MRNITGWEHSLKKLVSRNIQLENSQKRPTRKNKVTKYCFKNLRDWKNKCRSINI